MICKILNKKINYIILIKIINLTKIIYSDLSNNNLNTELPESWNNLTQLEFM